MSLLMLWDSAVACYRDEINRCAYYRLCDVLNARGLSSPHDVGYGN